MPVRVSRDVICNIKKIKEEKIKNEIIFCSRATIATLVCYFSKISNIFETHTVLNAALWLHSNRVTRCDTCPLLWQWSGVAT